jgi:hypothetical protein
VGDDYQLAFPILLGPGAYRLRFAVADAFGNIGSVEHTVEARLPRLGSVSVSDLFTTWEEGDGKRRFLALERLPDIATELRAFIELYPTDAAAPPAGLIVRLALLRAGESAPILEDEITPARDGAILTAVGEIPVDALTPGNYTIRVTVVEAGVVTGTVTTHVRKAG